MKKNEYMDALSRVQSEYNDSLSIKSCKLLKNLKEDEFISFINSDFYWSDLNVDEEFDFKNIPSCHELYQIIKLFISNMVSNYKTTHFLGGIFHNSSKQYEKTVRRNTANKVPGASFGDYDQGIYHNIMKEIVESIIELTETSIHMSFSSKLRQLQTCHGFSDTDIAKKCGLVNSRYNYYVNGEQHPDKNTVLLFSIIFELSLNETTEFLNLSGYNWNNTLTDRIVWKYITCKNYNVDQINRELINSGENVLSQKRRHIYGG